MFRSYCEHPGTASVLFEWISVSTANYLNEMSYDKGAAQACLYLHDLILSLHMLPE